MTDWHHLRNCFAKGQPMGQLGQPVVFLDEERGGAALDGSGGLLCDRGQELR